jgi:hypothetical protein
MQRRMISSCVCVVFCAYENPAGELAACAEIFSLLFSSFARLLFVCLLLKEGSRGCKIEVEERMKIA